MFQINQFIYHLFVCLFPHLIKDTLFYLFTFGIFHPPTERILLFNSLLFRLYKIYLSTTFFLIGQCVQVIRQQ